MVRCLETDEQKGPKLDQSKIDFPTDKVTLAQMRRLSPEFFDSGAMVYWENELPGVLTTHQIEQELAAKAFARAAGTPRPSLCRPRELLIDLLHGGYQELGLSTGKQQTKQLVRRFEDAAVAQAVATRGR